MTRKLLAKLVFFKSKVFLFPRNSCQTRKEEFAIFWISYQIKLCNILNTLNQVYAKVVTKLSNVDFHIAKTGASRLFLLRKNSCFRLIGLDLNLSISEFLRNSCYFTYAIFWTLSPRFARVATQPSLRESCLTRTLALRELLSQSSLHYFAYAKVVYENLRYAKLCTLALRELLRNQSLVFLLRNILDLVPKQKTCLRQARDLSTTRKKVVLSTINVRLSVSVTQDSSFFALQKLFRK